MTSDTGLIQAQHLFSLGVERFKSGDYLGSMQLWQQALTHAPGRISILVNLSIAQLKIGKLKAAAITIKRALEIDPTNSEAWKILMQIPAEYRSDLPALTVDHQRSKTLAEFLAAGRSALGQRNFETALACFSQALLISPKSVPAVIGKLSAIFESAGDEAALQYAHDMQRHFGHSAEFLSDLGLLREKSGDFNGALLAYSEALNVDPRYSHAKLRKGLLLLMLGHFAEGWKLYEARFGQDNLIARYARIPRLQNLDQAKNKNVLVWAEQGLGDTLQFLRYIQPMMAKGIHVFLEVPPELVSITTRNIPITVGDDLVNQREYAFQIPLLSVAGLLWDSLGHFGDSVPYLMPELSKPSGLPKPPIHKLQIGVVCSGNPKHNNDGLRSLPVSAFLGLGSSADLYLVQKEVRPSDLSLLAENPWFLDCSSLISDFDDTARLISTLDCVISVDTAVAHLAGAMGKKVFLILPPHSDWRWGLNGSATPWYPSMTVLRRDKRQGPSSFMKTLQNALDALTADLTMHRQPQKA
jgi:tetratricopeptide (TPR) repeat protein